MEDKHYSISELIKAYIHLTDLFGQENADKAIMAHCIAQRRQRNEEPLFGDQPLIYKDGELIPYTED